jgi:hypothetical protein
VTKEDECPSSLRARAIDRGDVRLGVSNATNATNEDLLLERGGRVTFDGS